MRQHDDDNFEPLMLRGEVTAKGIEELRSLLRYEEAKIDHLRREVEWADRQLARRRLRLVTT